MNANCSLNPDLELFQLVNFHSECKTSFCENSFWIKMAYFGCSGYSKVPFVVVVWGIFYLKFNLKILYFFLFFKLTHRTRYSRVSSISKT